MENTNEKETSPILIAAGIALIIVVMLGGLGMIAFQQKPMDMAAQGNLPSQQVALATPAATATATEKAPFTPTQTPTPATTPTKIPEFDSQGNPPPGSKPEVAAASEAVTTTADAASPPAVAEAVVATAATTETTASVTSDVATAAVTETTTTETTAVSDTTTTAAPDAGTTAAVTETSPVTETAPVTSPPVVPVADAAPSAPVDIAAVKVVVTKGTCGACHTIPGIDIAVGMIGPNLATIGTDAATRVPNYTAEAYIRESILNPNAFIAPKCPTGACLPNLMLPNLAQLLTPEEIDTVVNYLLMLKGQ